MDNSRSNMISFSKWLATVLCNQPRHNPFLCWPSTLIVSIFLGAVRWLWLTDMWVSPLVSPDVCSHAAEFCYDEPLWDHSQRAFQRGSGVFAWASCVQAVNIENYCRQRHRVNTRTVGIIFAVAELLLIYLVVHIHQIIAAASFTCNWELSASGKLLIADAGISLLKL